MAKDGRGSCSETKKDLLRAIPKVDEFLGWVEGEVQAPLAFVKAVVRELLASEREAILRGDCQSADALCQDNLLHKFKNALIEKMRPNFRTVINGTGVIIHTNMGRSLLPPEAMEGLVRVGAGYSNLEFDLATGRRGSRYSLVEEMLCQLTGAEAGLVVNNNAAAVLLVLDTLAKGKEVVVSRGQLVEIGGSFRIPEVMEKSGAVLHEVGATNRTHLKDYEGAINEETSLLLKVHMSNYRIIGFTKEVATEDLVSLGARYGLPVMDDLGSGSLVDLTRFGLEKEPTVQEVVGAGVDVVTFSGDKLLGGPQAGLIVGKQRIIDKIKQNPLNRALRIDKFTLAGLEAVFRLYLEGEDGLMRVPTLAMMAMDLAEIERRARRLARRLRKPLADECDVKVVQVESRVGGGAMPEQGLESRAVSIRPHKMKLSRVERCLREADIPVIGRVEDDQLLFDMRTVADGEVVVLADTVLDLLQPARG